MKFLLYYKKTLIYLSVSRGRFPEKILFLTLINESLENLMKTVATLITAATLAVASTAASAWGYGPYGYAPYGYGVPVAPAAELTEEQKQAIADQQAKAAEYFQAAQKQAYEFHAAQFAPIAEMERNMFEQRNADMQEMHTRMQEMHAEMQKNIQESMQYRPVPTFDRAAPAYDRASIDAERAAYQKEAEARMEEYRKAAEQRRADAEERFKARRLERTSPVKVETGA
jgi:hypothetical protein